MVKDGLVFKDENGQVIFNQHSFCELVKCLLVELVGISYEEASQIVERSSLATPVADAMEWRYSAMSCPITGPCCSTMGTVIGKRESQRSQWIWIPMKLWKTRSWKNIT